jgi:hypothetical protein
MHDLVPAVREMTRLVESVRDEQLGPSTPCSEYTLGDLMQHVRGLAEAFTLAARKEQPAGGSRPPSQGDAGAGPHHSRAAGAALTSRSSDRGWARFRLSRRC